MTTTNNLYTTKEILCSPLAFFSLKNKNELVNIKVKIYHFEKDDFLMSDWQDCDTDWKIIFLVYWQGSNFTITSRTIIQPDLTPLKITMCI